MPYRNAEPMLARCPACDNPTTTFFGTTAGDQVAVCHMCRLTGRQPYQPERHIVEGTVTWTSSSVYDREADVLPDGEGWDHSLLRVLETLVDRRVRVAVEVLPDA